VRAGAATSRSWDPSSRKPCETPRRDRLALPLRAGPRGRPRRGHARHAHRLLAAQRRSLALGACALEEAPLPPEAATGEVQVDLSRPFREARDAWTTRFERAYLGALLAHHGGNIRAAARAAGIDRVNLYRLLAKLDLR